MERGRSVRATADRDEAELDTSVGKALTLLTAVASAGSSIGVTTLAGDTGIPKSTAFRLLSLLERRGLIEREGTRYRVGVALFELGNRIPYCQPRNLRDVALPHLLDLHARTGSTVSLAVLDGSDILFLEKIFSHDLPRGISHTGGRAPAHCTALGKVLLAFSGEHPAANGTNAWLEPRTPYTIIDPRLLALELDTVRSSGFAIDREESSLGLACVAAPVLAEDGHGIASVAVAGRTPRMEPERHAQAVRRTALAITRELRHSHLA